jgi:2-polyprenyl-3-methyl-5-hydroxy-6-metoxy-1,4-benzoquinol methylase
VGQLEKPNGVPLNGMTGPIVAGSGFHESLAEGWAARYRAGSFRRRLNFLRQDIAALPRDGLLWLDAGCGSGVFSQELAASGASVTAVDASPKMLEEARKHVSPYSAAVEYIAIDTLENIPLPDSRFDGIVCLSVIEYVDDPYAAVRELHRLLKPGGHLLITTPNNRSIVRAAQQLLRACGRPLGKEWYSYLSVSKHSFSQSGCRRLMAESSFRTTRVRMFSPVAPAILTPLGLGAMWSITARKP